MKNDMAEEAPLARSVEAKIKAARTADISKRGSVKCPECGAASVSLDSRASGDICRRNRICIGAFPHRFTTYEAVISSRPVNVKKLVDAIVQKLEDAIAVAKTTQNVLDIFEEQ